MKTEGALQACARKGARSLFGVLRLHAMASLWTPFIDERILAHAGRVAIVALLAPVPLATGAWRGWLCARSRTGAKPRRFSPRWACSRCATWARNQPVPCTSRLPRSRSGCAAAPQSQASCIGTLFRLPIIFTYIGWSYWVFRGKVRADSGYH
jgi:cytochrome d ubiquinol oxidase subunit II